MQAGTFPAWSVVGAGWFLGGQATSSGHATCTSLQDTEPEEQFALAFHSFLSFSLSFVGLSGLVASVTFATRISEENSSLLAE